MKDGGIQDASSLRGLMQQTIGYALKDVEEAHILNTLHACYGNRTRAAKMLGISIRTLRNKLSSYSKTGAAIPWAKRVSSAPTILDDIPQEVWTSNMDVFNDGRYRDSRR